MAQSTEVVRARPAPRSATYIVPVELSRYRIFVYIIVKSTRTSSDAATRTGRDYSYLLVLCNEFQRLEGVAQQTGYRYSYTGNKDGIHLPRQGT